MCLQNLMASLWTLVILQTDKNSETVFILKEDTIERTFESVAMRKHLLYFNETFLISHWGFATTKLVASNAAWTGNVSKSLVMQDRQCAEEFRKQGEEFND